jgi:hypothetical protein
VSQNAKELIAGAYKLPDWLLLPVRLDKIAEMAKQ